MIDTMTIGDHGGDARGAGHDAGAARAGGRRRLVRAGGREPVRVFVIVDVLVYV